MKVVLASHVADMTSGAERSLLAIAQYLHDRGATVTVILPGPGSFQQALDERGIAYRLLEYDWAVRSHGSDGADRSGWRPWARSSGCSRDIDPDVVFTNTSVIPWFAYAANYLGLPHAWRISEDLFGGRFRVLPRRRDDARLRPQAFRHRVRGLSPGGATSCGADRPSWMCDRCYRQWMRRSSTTPRRHRPAATTESSTRGRSTRSRTSSSCCAPLARCASGAPTSRSR